ncbi:hypothetical protein [Klenkia brasiliensis]|uniref:Uncharacterized protein n=1 Tax=Klenkia brasiliensis TaxID=333142 RepID=A0A1G7XHZ4_9ACTN|nr:hypothetical protein [Klenkia brasiliensis]SDG83838.1 hypothetical protein SAMN05660324_3668 [Klenkia brasiliensis]
MLGFVTGGLTAVGSLAFLVGVLTGSDDVSSRVLILGLPCAAAMVWGGVRVLQRRPGPVLLVGTLAAVGVLLLSLVIGLARLSADERYGITGFTVVALVLPVTTAVFAALPTVRSWSAGPPG